MSKKFMLNIWEISIYWNVYFMQDYAWFKFIGMAEWPANMYSYMEYILMIGYAITGREAIS